MLKAFILTLIAVPVILLIIGQIAYHLLVVPDMQAVETPAQQVEILHPQKGILL